MKSESKSSLKKVSITTGRILVILLVVGLVAGGLYWLGQNHPAILGLGDNRLGLPEEGTRPGREAREMFDREDRLENGLPLDFPGDGMYHNEGLGRLDAGRAWASILRNILIIAVITLLVVGIQRFYNWLVHRRKASVA